MLATLRKYRKNVFGSFLLVIICITMVGFGVDYYGNSNEAGAALRVDDTEVSLTEYNKRYAQLQKVFENQFGENYPQIAGMLNLEQQTVDQLINSILLGRFTESLGLAASEKSIREKILSHPFLRGGATQQSYRAFLQALRMTQAELVQQIGVELVNEQLRTAVSNLNEPTQAELQLITRDESRKASFRYVQYPAATFASAVDVSNAETVKAYYVDTAERYRKPKAVRFIAVPFEASMFVPKVEVTEADIAEYFERTSEKYFDDKKVTFRQIVLKKQAAPSTSVESMVEGKSDSSDPAIKAANDAQKAKAEEARKRVKDGADFAQVAREVTEDPEGKANGGLVDWTLYDPLNPAVRTALAALDAGELSSVIDTSDAYYVVEVADKEDRKPKPLDQVRDEVTQALKTDLAPEYAQAAAEAFLEKLNRESSATVTLRSTAQDAGYRIISPEDYLTRGQQLPGLPPGMSDDIVQLPANQPQIVSAAGIPYIVEVTEIKESYVPEFDEAKEAVIASYRAQHAGELAKKAAQEDLAALAADKTLSFDAIAAKRSLKAVVVPEGTKTEVKDPILSNPDFKRAAWALSKSLPRASSVLEANGSYYLLEQASENVPDKVDVTAAQQLAKKESEEAGNRVMQVVLATMKARSDVWVNPDVLEKRR